MTEAPHFDLTGALPRGTTLLEASAGTGKTYAIAALAARYLAEDGVDVSRLLLITFGRHATGELRSRVFARLTGTVAALDEVLAGRALPDPEDAVAAHLAAGDAAVHRRRLAAAVERFNELTILTTHAFCQAMLHELGILGDWDPAEEVGPDPVGLVRQCSADTYLRLFRADPQPPLQPRAGFQIGDAACTTTLPILPASGPHGQFATEVRRLYAQRKADLGLCTYDDVVVRLRRLLEQPDSGTAVRAELRRRFSVVLVDEFQDTDPEQWAIVQAAFVEAERATILIGDPKQSIYAFRGADLHSYLAAKAQAEVHTLAVNFRSDAALVEGVTELFAGAPLGDESVAVDQVTARHTTRLTMPISQRVWLRTGSTRTMQGKAAAAAIDADLIFTIANLVHLTRFTHRGADSRVRYSDIAILVRSGARARQLRGALERAGVPAVLTGNQSVWTQPAARDWTALLTAMADPTQATIRLGALTTLIGSDLGALLAPDSTESARVSTLIRTLTRLFAEGGLPRVFSHLRAAEHLDERLLREQDGDRALADLAQVAELLDACGERTLSGILTHLAQRSSEEDGADLIRVSTDEEAVRVMTIHAAKGLEFPIVLLPETDGVPTMRSRPFTVVHDGERRLYVGPAPSRDESLARELEDQTLAEETRLLYVGFTRAQHCCIAWHVEAAGSAAKRSPLSGLVRSWRRRQGAGATVSAHVSVSDFTPDPPPQVPALPRSHVTLRAAVLSRKVDQTWRRTSYSGLTQDLHELAPPSVLTDEDAEVDISLPAPASAALAALSLMDSLPAGAGFGTMVHEAFERLEWGPATLVDSAARLVAELGPQHALDPTQREALAEALVAVCRTPLLPLSTATLSDLPTSRRLPELAFDLPLADQGRASTLRDLAALMADHLPATDPLAAYPDRLRSSEAATAVLNGSLTGSIDAVLQLEDGRFIVVDYKTNRIAHAGEPVTLGHFTAAALAEAMMQAHYPLQAMLYCVALHRFLTLRLPAYAPDLHLGGAGYLFVRGMAGANTPVIDGASCGVMGWRPPWPLVVEASALLGGLDA